MPSESVSISAQGPRAVASGGSSSSARQGEQEFGTLHAAQARSLVRAQPVELVREGDGASSKASPPHLLIHTSFTLRSHPIHGRLSIVFPRLADVHPQ